MTMMTTAQKMIPVDDVLGSSNLYGDGGGGHKEVLQLRRRQESQDKVSVGGLSVCETQMRETDHASTSEMSWPPGPRMQKRRSRRALILPGPRGTK
jgi:hypothetical protein